MKLLRKHVFHLSAIPRDLDPIITIDKKKEVDPRDVGLLQPDVERIWDTIVKLYRTGVHPAITACIRHQGKVLLSRSIGHARGNGPDDDPDSEKVLATPDTPMCLFSTSKGITALLMHMLQEDGLVNVSDPVAFYAPEFARKGKDNITIHQILAHRGGIPGLPKDVDLEVLWDEDRTWELLCDAKPIVTDGSRLAYHAITGGFVLERVVRQVTGADINAYIAKKIREPMGMKYFSYGIEDEYLDDLAQSYATGPRPGPLMGAFIKRALGTDIVSVEKLANDPRFQQAIIPSGNLAGTAEEACRFFQMMLNGGKWGRRRICSERTVARTLQEFGTRTLDRTLFIPMRFSAGLMLGDEPFGIWGPNSRQAFGHLGLVNKFAWADPQRDLSAAILTSGLPVIAHHIPALVNVIRSIAKTVPVRDCDPKPFALQLE
ncbi:serine hydrolase [Kineobactrum sediminis]|uniref:Serine hydrolase n=1 Tax=Kineobactrum sediminis TaxID=1905677 RepID=A0A2N5XYG0_9GAMM|nr:serine hydrolase domain-containing protein [Kineobactrum sediminis]PLW81181.1 serine hydrolase [Kineobactrum sediminis]